ncbi:MAG: ATP-binding protein [Planctomycetes bacterium]|jgi:signal transduction histidine kinase|nr:ATP-binding protein [Planctomycetota bacterium]
MNKLLQRQIEKFLGGGEAVPPGLEPLFEAISDAYDGFDADRRLIERSLDISSEELTQINQKLRKEISEHRATEDKLAGVNQELNAFAYVVSHDLKAPLRGIRTLADWIATDYADRLGPEGQEQCRLLQNRTGRMQDLIDGILQYARVGRVCEERVRVDLAALLPEIVDLLAPPSHIEIILPDALPVICLERTRVRQVFQNLLSNAIKYLDKPQGRITLSCRGDDAWWTFSVTDNGPGIDQKYHDRIFQLFQTLAPHEDSESTGIGLSLVKKIVETYGGRVWVESTLGEGSTFFFTLPRMPVSPGEEPQPLCAAAASPS